MSSPLLGIRAALTRAEGRWFDVTRRVQTEGYFAVLQVKSRRAASLHREAERNISNYRDAGRRRADVESVQMDATEYVFPDSKLILYLYKPFHPEMLRKVFLRLEKSLAVAAASRGNDHDKSRDGGGG